MPPSTADTYCLNWCSQNLHSDLVAVEVYRNSQSMYCYCDFTGGSIPSDINSSDYDPAAQGSIIYTGDGAVSSTDFTGGASCYRNDVSHGIVVILFIDTVSFEKLTHFI